MTANLKLRRLLNAGLLILAAALPLAALLPAALAAEPVVLRRGNMSEPGTLDPHMAGASWENVIIGDLFLGLTTESMDGKPIAGAAESWTVSPDGLAWTFKLRPGLQWSDGAAFTAANFVFSFQRLLDPKTAAQYASIQYAIKNAEAVNNGKLPVSEVGVRALDDLTLEIRLESPTPYLPGLLTHYTAFPIPEHAFKKFGEDWKKPGNMISNGAYKLVEWKAHELVRVVKNPRFYDAKNVAIDEVYYYPTDDQAAALNRFRARELDVNLGTKGFPIGQYPWLQENMPGEAHIAPMLGIEYIALNIRRPPFTDQRLRRAVSLCLERAVITDKVLRDRQVPAFAFVPPGIDNYHNTARLDFAALPKDQRQAEAKRLLAEAGYGADNPFTFEYMYMISIDSRRSVVAQAAMLKECGMVMRLVGNEPKIHYDALRAKNFTAAQARWGADFNDPQTFLYLLDSRSGVYNYVGYNSPAFDRLVDEGRNTLDLEKRAEILARAEQTALNDGSVVPLSFFTYKSLVAPYVKGYADNAVDINRTRWMWIER
ncbi:MAG: peptide ABC transporter substrate-binding protein [Rhodospirillaceae bacterium]|nr:peptide ABC transporter substrate-binding protein [Rhodospirillaceae bacterium]